MKKGNETMQRRGFTLIELLVIIAIIVILAAILFPVFARARENEADLSRGVTMISTFPDEARVLATAFEDLEIFLRAGDIASGGDYKIEFSRRAMEIEESYRIEIGGEKTVIFAADSEGVRRAIFQLEDEMRRAGGPFLPIGKIKKTPVIRTRISRCFFWCAASASTRNFFNVR